MLGCGNMSLDIDHQLLAEECPSYIRLGCGNISLEIDHQLLADRS
jgi:hypothetical protein